jgi:hypothetical protein
MITGATIKGIKPRLYCDSRMLIYTEKGYDRETGEITNQDLQQALGGKAHKIRSHLQGHMLIQMIYEGAPLPDGQKGAYWNPDTKYYMFEHGASATVTPCQNTVDAFNVPADNTIVLCPYLLTGTKRASLLQYSQGTLPINNGDTLDSYNSKPGTFMHELAHLVKSDSKFALEFA